MVKNISFYGWICLWVLGTGCSGGSDEKESEGEALARQYCSSCHLYTPPDLLPRQVWRTSVLPQMGWLLGIKDSAVNPMKNLSWEDKIALQKARVYPSKPLVAERDWQQIVDYILANAPEEFPDTTKKVTKAVAENFQFRSEKVFGNFPYLTMTRFDDKNKRVFVSSQRGELAEWSQNTTEVKTRKVNSPAVDISFSQENPIVTLIGYMHPSEARRGSLLPLGNDGESSLIEELSRPVQSSFGDLTGNGLLDIAVCTFGNQTGYFSWFEQTADSEYVEHQLLARPGAIKSHMHDFNKDGKLDIVVLMAQGDEEIILFQNRGDGTFDPLSLARFPAVYGSNDLELADFNQDGFTDLVYSNGDNADHSIVPKPYHGIRIFLNDQTNSFSEQFFYPMDGASGITVADFDEDGDPDIAGIAYFANFGRQDPEGFVILENKGKLEFQPKTVPQTREGHWLLIDKGDIDEDGDIDILLGSNIFSVAPVPDSIKQIWAEKQHDLVILENLLK